MSKAKKRPSFPDIFPSDVEGEFEGIDMLDDEEDDYQEPDTWTIISAMDRVLNLARDSRLSDHFWITSKSPLSFLHDKLGLTDMQIIVLAIMIEAGNTVTWRQLGNFLGITRLSMMVYSDEIEELVNKRWITHSVKRDPRGNWQGYHLVFGVVKALRHNEVFVPESIENLSEQQFVDKIVRRVGTHSNDPDYEFEYDEEWMMQLIEANRQLPICKELQQIDDKHARSLLLMAVYDYARWGGDENEGLTLVHIETLYNDFGGFLCSELRTGNHILMQRGLIEHKCEDGIADTEQYVLTKKTKSELLSAYTPNHVRKDSKGKSPFLKSYTSIKEKALFFNAAEQQQIERLTSLLHVDNLPSIQQRLEEQGMRKGFACLFYGDPGTGKTETVMQIARQTGRDLMQIDIAGLRDKWVGESEKNIKSVFTRYRELCKKSDVMPILFFNEADAIIGKRNENAEQSVDKMNNAMQNIILQEMEDLDGILFATTNLTTNLDRAFERRFLFKVEFHKPDTEVKEKIWMSMLKNIGSDEAHLLATHFDFSGGQIENVARKRTIDYILTGKFASLDEIEEYCRAEILTGKERRSIGFTL